MVKIYKKCHLEVRTLVSLTKFHKLFRKCKIKSYILEFFFLFPPCGQKKKCYVSELMDLVLTIPMYGFKSVKLSNECAKIVNIIDKTTQIIFLPVLSIKSPNIGDATADIIYNILFTVFASSDEKLNFSLKNTLKEKKVIKFSQTFPILFSCKRFVLEWVNTFGMNARGGKSIIHSQTNPLLNPVKIKKKTRELGVEIYLLYG